MDTFEGNQSDPLSLHAYLYCRAQPVSRVDPSGHLDLLSTLGGMYLGSQLRLADAVPYISATALLVLSISFPQLDAIPPGSPGPFDELSQFGRAARTLGGSWVPGTTRWVKSYFQNRLVHKNLTDFVISVPESVDRARVNPAVLELLDRGLSNLDLMKSGYAPIGKDGLPIVLHHTLGDEPGPVAELLGSVHERFTRSLHGFIEAGRSWRRSPDKLAQFEKFREEHWMNRAAEVQSATSYGTYR